RRDRAVGWVSDDAGLSFLGFQVFTRSSAQQPRNARARNPFDLLGTVRAQRTRSMRPAPIARRIYDSDDDDGPVVQEELVVAAESRPRVPLQCDCDARTTGKRRRSRAGPEPARP